MGTFINEIKKQASCFLQDKYRIARLAFTDVSEAELLAEQATSNDPWGPDAKTMTQLAEASFDVDDYWRIVDVLHRRFYSIEWKHWRQSYKSLVLLEFLITHGPEAFAEEFQCNADIIQELGTFKHIDEKGFNWGANMQKRSEHILQLLGGGQTLKEARLKAIKITSEIQGFGNCMVSPASSTVSPSSSEVSGSSFGSYLSTNSTWDDVNDQLSKLELLSPSKASAITNYSQGGIREEKLKNHHFDGFHLWDSPRAEETGALIEADYDGNEESDGLFSGICSKFAAMSPSKRLNGDKVPFRSFSDISQKSKLKNLQRQYSVGY